MQSQQSHQPEFRDSRRHNTTISAATHGTAIHIQYLGPNTTVPLIIITAQMKCRANPIGRGFVDRNTSQPSTSHNNVNAKFTKTDDGNSTPITCRVT